MYWLWKYLIFFSKKNPFRKTFIEETTLLLGFFLANILFVTKLKYFKQLNP